MFFYMYVVVTVAILAQVMNLMIQLAFLLALTLIDVVNSLSLTGKAFAKIVTSPVWKAGEDMTKDECSHMISSFVEHGPEEWSNTELAMLALAISEGRCTQFFSPEMLDVVLHHLSSADVSDRTSSEMMYMTAWNVSANGVDLPKYREIPYLIANGTAEELALTASMDDILAAFLFIKEDASHWSSTTTTSTTTTTTTTSSLANDGSTTKEAVTTSTTGEVTSSTSTTTTTSLFVDDDLTNMEAVKTTTTTSTTTSLSGFLEMKLKSASPRASVLFVSLYLLWCGL